MCLSEQGVEQTAESSVVWVVMILNILPSNFFILQKYDIDFSAQELFIDINYTHIQEINRPMHPLS